MMRARFSTSNTMQSGIPQGTMGGVSAAGARPGTRSLLVGDEVYLWALVLLEVGVMGFMRNKFKRHHGG